MPPKFKITGSSRLALVFLTIAFIANLVILITNSLQSSVASIEQYRNQVMPLNMLGFIKSALLLWMAFLLFRLLQLVSKRVKWYAGYYKKIKGIAWLNVAVLLIDAFMAVGKDLYLYSSTSLTQKLTDQSTYTNTLLKALFAAPVSWFLILCIFLIADVLQYASQVKMENDSII